MYGKGRCKVENANKLTIRLDKSLIEDAKQYAAHHQTTVTQLIATYLRYLTRQEPAPDALPVLNRLSGILPEDVSTDAYQNYLAEKYG